MSGTPILLSFFFIFTIATLLIPTPIFPGSFLPVIIGAAVSDYTQYLSALINGVFYGMIVWMVFVAISRRLDQEK